MLSKLKLLGLFIVLCQLCYGQIPILNSQPATTRKVIYLDFDGQVVSGTAWNGGQAVNAMPSTKSAAEITTIFQRIAEDYRPFDVNVTTDSLRFNAATPNTRIRVVFTPTSAWYGSAGGVAFLGSFVWGGTPGTPCWVFENQLGYSVKNMAEAAAHEVGHTLTLRHQSSYTSNCVKTEYHPGTGSGITSWAPIMGVGYSKNITIWHNGKSATSCSTIQNDHGNSGIGITSPGYLNFIPDDVGNTLGTAKILNLTNINLLDSGIITQPTDIDAYQFTICDNRYVTIGVKPWALDTNSYLGADLDVRFFLYNATTTSVLAVDTALTKLNTLRGLTLTPGTYYFTVDGGRSNYYSDYGSLGKYYVSIKATNPPQIANTITLNPQICAGQTLPLTYSTNGVPTQWQWIVSGPSAGTYSIQNPNHTFSAGNYTISLLANSSTSTSCETTMTLTVGNTPTLTVSNFTNILCPGRSTSLTASGAASYTWLPGAFGGSLQTITPFASTNYTVIGANGSCSASAVIQVTVSPNFTLSLAASATTICAGESVTLTANGANAYTMNPGNFNTNSVIYTPVSTDTYIVTGRVNSCNKQVGVQVTVIDFDITLTASDSLICSGQSVTLKASGATSYTFNPGALTGSMVVVSPTTATIYTVTAKKSNKCPEDTTLLIEIEDCAIATGIENKMTDSEIKIYPNPSQGSFYIDQENLNQKIEILNSLGQIVYTKTLTEKSTEIKTEAWPKGIYFVKVYSGNGRLISESYRTFKIFLD
ncbi:hypothetical protein CNR22_15185 [Sphingobacteriaceae bacterium]|nr:hypothetical protein CNR22_15185 [Sphingobacteriaceae bacterium]